MSSPPRNTLDARMHPPGSTSDLGPRIGHTGSSVSISASSTSVNTLAQGSGSQDVHQLTLKVMRLSKPTFATDPGFFVEPQDFAHGSFNQVEPASVFGSDSLETFEVSEILKLPLNFGSIFLGENFSCYICVNNESNTLVKDVGIKAELQTSSQRFSLIDTVEKPRAELPHGEVMDHVIDHEIKELGVHILVCSVHYQNFLGERKTLRKYFKFPVQNPLAVKTKVYNVKEDVFLEAQIQNISARVMCLENLRFEASPLFHLTDLNILSSTPGADGKPAHVVTTFDSSRFLNPQDVKQYLYKLSPKDEKGKTTNTIGKLDIIWKTSMGERGRLQTSQLPRKVPVYPEIEVDVTKAPEVIRLEEPFTIGISVSNNTTSIISLRLFFIKSKMGHMSYVGPSSVALGEIRPQQKKLLDLTLFPLAPGLQKIGGIGLTDSSTGKVVEIENLTDIFVLRE